MNKQKVHLDHFWQPVISFTIKLYIKGMSAPLDMFAFLRVYKSVNSMKRKPKKKIASIKLSLGFMTETHTFEYKVFGAKVNSSKEIQLYASHILTPCHTDSLGKICNWLLHHHQ